MKSACVVAIFSVGLSAVAVAQKAPVQPPASLHPVTVFEGKANRRSGETTTSCPSFTVQRWKVAERDKEQRVFLEGSYLAHLRSGRMKTIIDGVSTVREPNDFWLVKRGSSMLIQVLGQTAVFDTLTATSR